MVRVQGQNNTGHHALATGMRKATEGTPQALIRMLTSMCGFLVADFFEPADDFGTKMRKVLPRFGTVFFAINDGLSWGIDFLRVFSRRRAFRELFFTLWTLSSLFNAVAVAAYVYLRCTRRSPPALTALVVFSWTAGNAVGSAITFRQNALCILTAVILSNVALAPLWCSTSSSPLSPRLTAVTTTVSFWPKSRTTGALLTSSYSSCSPTP